MQPCPLLLSGRISHFLHTQQHHLHKTRVLGFAQIARAHMGQLDYGYSLYRCKLCVAKGPVCRG